MNKTLILLVLIFISSNSSAQEQVVKNDSNSENIICNCDNIAIYKLFPTQNMWTFIKLNTRNGKMWQVQFDVQGDNRLETFLNMLPLASIDEEVNGRFTLYPTENIYTFILLDQINGKTWQAQWSTDIQNRGVIPIE